MAFFDEIKKQMSGVAQSAQKAAEVARLHHQVSVKQNEFENIFTKIGRLYYDARKLEAADTAEMDNLCEHIDELAAQIAELKGKIDEIRQIRRCTQCGSVQNNESNFCASCGAKLPEREVKTEAAEEKTDSAEEAYDPEADEKDAPKDDFKDDFKEALRDELRKEYGEDGGKGVYISWPETEKTEAAPEAAADTTEAE